MITNTFQQNLIGLNDKLKGYAMYLTANPEEAQDLVQDTYLKALKYAHKYQSNTNLRAWSFTIMRNTFINNHRKLSAKKQVAEISDQNYSPVAQVKGYTPTEHTLLKKEIENQINNLNDKLAKPFHLYIEGYKYKEIADKLHTNIGTIKSRIFFAREKLMDQLNEYS